MFFFLIILMSIFFSEKLLKNRKYESICHYFTLGFLTNERHEELYKTITKLQQILSSSVLSIIFPRIPV